MPFLPGKSSAVGQMGGLARARRQYTNKLVTRAIDQILDESDPARGRRRALCLALSMYKEAMRGNVFAAKFLTERHEGLPKQEVDIATNGEIKQINVNMSLDELSGLYAESLRYGDVIEATALPSVGAPQPASSSTSARNGSSNCSSAPRAGGSIPRIRRSKR